MKEKLLCYRVRDDSLNLSSKNYESACRMKNEDEIALVRAVSALDASHIQQALKVKCDNISKYRVLFEYYRTKNRISKSKAMSIILYDKLGPECTIPSELFSDFFGIYSKNYIFDGPDLKGIMSSRLNMSYVSFCRESSKFLFKKKICLLAMFVPKFVLNFMRKIRM